MSQTFSCTVTGFHPAGAQSPSGAENTVRRTSLQDLHRILTAPHLCERTDLAFRGAVGTLLSLHSLCKGNPLPPMKRALLCRGTAALQHLRAAAWCFWRHQKEGEKPIAMSGSRRESRTRIHLSHAVSQTGSILFH